MDSFRILPHLVALAACSVVQATEVLPADRPEGTARTIGKVITGIGFIGGGAIVEHGSSVLGTATAPRLWATGSMGMSVDPGADDPALAVSVPIIATLRFIVPHQGGTGDHGKAEP